MERWKAIGIYANLEALGGEIIMEPRGPNSKVTIDKGFPNAKHGKGGKAYEESNSSASGFVFSSDISQQIKEVFFYFPILYLFNCVCSFLWQEERELKDIVSRLDKILLTKKRCVILAVFQV